jgi:hypothetical protein
VTLLAIVMTTTPNRAGVAVAANKLPVSRPDPPPPGGCPTAPTTSAISYRQRHHGPIEQRIEATRPLSEAIRSRWPNGGRDSGLADDLDGLIGLLAHVRWLMGLSDGKQTKDQIMRTRGNACRIGRRPRPWWYAANRTLVL